MTGKNDFDRLLTDALAPIADEAPMPDDLLQVRGAWIRSGPASAPVRWLAVAVVVGAAAVVTLAGIAAVRGGLSVPFIGGPREPVAIPGLAPDERRTLEEADRIINSTLIPEEWPTIVNAHGAVVTACMQAHGWEFEYGTATAETESGEPSTLSSLEQWTFADVSSAESVGYGFESYLADHAVWLESVDLTGGEAQAYEDSLSPEEADRYWRDFGGTEAERIEIVERDGSGSSRAGGGCLAEADRALYGDIEREMRLQDARGTAQSDIWMATLADPSVVQALNAWRDCLAGRGVQWADPHQAFDAALRYAQGGDHTQERLIASADAACKVESGLDRAVDAAFLAATNAVLPALEEDLIALQELEEDALVRAQAILGTAE
jgi:hypothetical protein